MQKESGLNSPPAGLQTTVPFSVICLADWQGQIFSAKVRVPAQRKRRNENRNDISGLRGVILKVRAFFAHRCENLKLCRISSYNLRLDPKAGWLYSCGPSTYA